MSVENMLLDIIEAKDEDDERLTEWEVEFIESIEEVYEEIGPRFSIPQEEKIEEIWNKVGKDL